MGDMCSSHEKMKIEKPAAFKMIWQSAAIVLLATAIGLLVNQVRPSRLTLVADWSTEAELAPESGESMVISLDEAQELFWSGAAVFLDARSSELYQHGHIAGARNLPGESVDEYCDRVKELGGMVLQTKMPVPGYGYLAVCMDTEENTFGLWEIDENAE